MFPSTVTRVERNTSERVNNAIQARMKRSIAYYAENPDEIAERLDELDHEWDIERTLEANAATISLAGIGLGALVDKRWLVLPFAVSGFLLQHALQRWCPPVVLFRHRGVRTASEINHERYALKALRGDFDNIEMAGEIGARERVENVLLHVKT
ncbi:hypothetical protein [Halomonas korlensis]|uniref:DUF2892 domain-containing protein n=1 Tax=Halomonas korlensis TaxID=463301 RepID=A0A1I7HWG7_9GAMM|nr:hypothetical protein [Halomonas korlensis]SFU65030.1 hypothetical protein SAMN04487955_105145 [Halomonas korlensis]